MGTDGIGTNGTEVSKSTGEVDATTPHSHPLILALVPRFQWNRKSDRQLVCWLLMMSQPSGVSDFV